MPAPIHPLTNEKDAVREILAADGSLLLGIRKDAIRRLRRLISEGVRAIPQQPGLEFGGLCVASKHALWGSTDTVFDFEPVEIQYQYGPRFRACPADRAIFEKAMAKHQTDGGSRVVGCFRSHLAVDLQIRKEDRWLMNVLLGQRGGFFMLIQPMFDEISVFSFGAGGTPLDTLPVARFSLRDGGPEMEKPKGTELPLTAANPPFVSSKPASTPVALERPSSLKVNRESASPLPQRPAASVTTVPLGGMAAVPGSARRPALGTTETTIPPKTPSDSTKSVWLVLLALLSLALAIFIVVARTPPTPSSTGLTVSSKGSTVEITWNVSSPAVKKAIRGTLFTTDDINSSQVNLTAAQVHQGRYEYRQATGDLFCEITFYQPDNTFVGETKTIRLKAAADSGPTSPRQRQQPVPASARALPSEPAPDYEADPIADSDPDSGETFVVKNDRVPFVPPPSNEVVRGPVIARPPDVQSNPAPVSAALPPVLMTLKPPAPAVTPPPRPAAPVTQSVTFTAAVPLKRVAPAVPAGARSLLHEPVVVTVVVEVDTHGKVTAARSSGVNTGLRRLLAPNSVEAARQWQFEPALRNGAPVASQTELSFRFMNP
jgi:hypothetical protein